MTLTFKLVDFTQQNISKEPNLVFLRCDNWDDYNYKTQFFVTVFDETGIEQSIGPVKIGMVGQEEGWTKKKLLVEEFSHLTEICFSLGQDDSYYENIKSMLSQDLGEVLLSSLRDVVYSTDILTIAKKENVFTTSLMRTVSLASINGHFKRILEGKTLLTEFRFSYHRPMTKKFAEVNLTFVVEPRTMPASNLHVLIGRNGVGKTTILNNIVSSIIGNNSDTDEVGMVSDIVESLSFNKPVKVSKSYFSSITSVSFSAFDPFTPPREQPNRNLGTCYRYVGLKNNSKKSTSELKTPSELNKEFVESLIVCFNLKAKKKRWLRAIETLESDTNFAEMGLGKLAEKVSESEVKKEAYRLVDLMSSGHTIVLLSITKLVETVEEKSLILVDEPESHLHPPLLSAFTRALSDLLIDRNAVAIVATHSPVVLQEVPKSCVWKLDRSRLIGSSYRPENETFGENVGVLTREVFGLEVSKSGYHNLLENLVNQGKSYNEIIGLYNNQIGFEGRAILGALIHVRDSDL